MKLSGMVYLYLDFEFSGWIAFSSLGPEAAEGPLGGLPGDVAEDLHDGGDQGLFVFFFCERIC